MSFLVYISYLFFYLMESEKNNHTQSWPDWESYGQACHWAWSLPVWSSLTCTCLFSLGREWWKLYIVTCCLLKLHPITMSLQTTFLYTLFSYKSMFKWHSKYKQDFSPKICIPPRPTINHLGYLGTTVWQKRKLLGSRWHHLVSSLRERSGLFWLLSYPIVWHCTSKIIVGTSLVAQESACQCRGHRFEPWSGKNPHARRATKPVRHNYWACALEPASHNYWARMPELLKPARLDPVLHNKRSHRNEKPRPTMKSSPCSPQLEKTRLQQRRPNTAKNKLKKKKKQMCEGMKMNEWMKGYSGQSYCLLSRRLGEISWCHYCLLLWSIINFQIFIQCLYMPGTGLGPKDTRPFLASRMPPGFLGSWLLPLSSRPAA